MWGREMLLLTRPSFPSPKVSALAKTSQQAGALAPVFIITSMLFGGFFIPVDDIPVWLSWIRVLSFIKYGFAGALKGGGD